MTAPHPLGRALSSFLMVIFISGALYSAYLYFSTIRALASRTSLPIAENVAPAAAPQGRAPEQELPNIESKKERINILLLGIDQRDNKVDKGPWRTDTMILVSIDPATKTASMLSIPRDLWVTIPGYGENRINTAHATGDIRKYPGGGVALAKKTVWYTFGVPVHYYVRINFVGFEKMIDAIGGVTINVEKPIHDSEYPDQNYGTIVVDIPAGVQHMDGKTALQYARTRHGSNDFDRMKRQQQVILAARDKVLSLNIPLLRVPQLIELAGSSIQTDMKLDEIIALAGILRGIDSGNIRHGVIDATMTTTVVTPQGAMVQMADWDKVRALVEQLFPMSGSAAEPTPSLLSIPLASEEARIRVQNGTTVPNLAEETTRELRDSGFNVIRYDSADRLDYDQTWITVYVDKPYTVQALAKYLGISPQNIRYQLDAKSDVDILVIIGQDYVVRHGG
jgi:polyisoprenyl-teichoic acid--peptidoglycan teichoic acid transferase